MLKKREAAHEKGNPNLSHPYAFRVSGPRNLSPPSWRDLLNSNWKDDSHKRALMACFVQAVYLLELDRQENRSDQTALAPNWWLPFKYKLIQTLVDRQDGSIFGALFEWDRPAALSNFIVMRPDGAPKAVLALRGTILQRPTILRDVVEDFRFLAWESLKGSGRFAVTLNQLRSVVMKYGSEKVCIAGHSIGAGFALQVGKVLAMEGIYVDAHLFNPPAFSLARGLGDVRDKAGVVWKKLQLIFPSSGSENASTVAASIPKEKTCISPKEKWVPNLYVNDNDYICCHYIDPVASKEKNHGAADASGCAANGSAKLYVISNGKQKFLEAHRLEQWWTDHADLKLAMKSSELISRQLRSLYNFPTRQIAQQRTQ